MKKHLKFIGVFAFTITCNFLNAQWIATGGPVVVNSDTTNYCTALYTDGTDIYSSQGLDRIFKTSNDGSSWTPVNNGLPPLGTYGFNLCITKQTNTLYTGIDEAGIYSSIDNGLNWVALPGNSVFSNLQIFDIFVTNNTILVATDSSIFISSNGGSSFSKATMNTTDNFYISEFTSLGSFIFASTEEGIYRSSDNGASWNSYNNGLNSNDLYFGNIATNGSNIYIGGDDQMMMSANNGSSWVDISGSLPSSMPLGFQIWDIVASGNDIIVAAVTLPNTSTSLYIGKVFKSSNNGSSWVDISNGLPNTEIITRLIKKGNVLFAGTAFSGVYKNGTLLSDETSLADEASISVYPNPASDLITVDLLNKNKAPEYYEISNTLGALVQGDRIENSNTFSINVNNLPHGVYFLSLFDKDGSITLSKKRFLVN